MVHGTAADQDLMGFLIGFVAQNLDFTGFFVGLLE